MTIQQCKYALEVARRGSFGVAAQRLFVAQTSISTALKRWKLSWGFKFLNALTKACT